MEQSNFAKILSNYGSRVWTMVSVFLFIPLYIRFLGAENYGLIGFYALLLGIISFADSGISSAIIREFSRNVAANYKYSIYRTLERIYLAICVFLCIIIYLCAGLIVRKWLNAEHIANDQLIYYVRLIGVGITTQVISSLYFGALFALNNQVRSNFIQLGWSVSRSAFVFLLFVIFTKSIEVYLIWQIICNILYVVILRFYTIRQLTADAGTGKLKVLFKRLPHHVTSYIGGLIFIAIISAVNIQADKFVTSSLFNLSTFGFYNIASSLAQFPVILAAPLVAFAFPLFSKFSNLNNPSDQNKSLVVFNKLFFLLNTIAVAATIAIFIYTEELLYLWTKAAIPKSLFPAIAYDVKVLILGSFFLALQFPFYYFLLSRGKTKYTIYQGVIQLIIGLPLLYYSAKKFGLYGVPITWFVINFSSFVYLFHIVAKKYLTFATMHFYKVFLIQPIVVCVIANVLIYRVNILLPGYFLAFSIGGSVISIFVSILFFNWSTNRDLLSYKHFYNFPHE